MNILLSRDACHATRDLLDREWLDANGRGGYASSTLLNCHTRKYHGLLVANLPEPACGRHVLLSKFVDSLITNRAEYPLCATQYPGVMVPELPLALAAFELTTHPAWMFQAGGVEVHRSLMLVHDEDCVLVRYVVTGCGSGARLQIRPLLAYRRNHHLMHANGAIRGAVAERGDGFSIAPYSGMPELHVQAAGGRPRCQPNCGTWYRDFEYLEEQRRGYDCREDLYLPAVLEIPVVDGEAIIVAAGLRRQRNLFEVWNAEASRRDNCRVQTLEFAKQQIAAPKDVSVCEGLLRAGEPFLITTPRRRPALLAGYHWFDDWGRDTMISLPGLTFWAGRAEAGFAILESFATREQGGRLPNFINPDDSACYNSIDASLWFFWTVQQYLLAGGDRARVQERLWPTLRRIIESLANGGSTADNVGMDSDGLLFAGTPETQLTWMDAQAGGKPVTPRWGYAVEINALWYNALAFCAQLSKEYGERHFKLPVGLGKAARAFQRKFWLPQGKYLADVVNRDGLDVSCRPNQIFAVSLPFSPLPEGMAEAVVEQVRTQLATPWGLRTLAPGHRDYKASYGGDGSARDQAYHQGTVWPWLQGAFVEAYLKVNRGSRPACALVRGLLNSWPQQLREAGIGTVAEIFDAEPPHRPNGCIAQAWSVAEVYRGHLLLWAAEKQNKARQSTR